MSKVLTEYDNDPILPEGWNEGDDVFVDTPEADDPAIDQEAEGQESDPAEEPDEVPEKEEPAKAPEQETEPQKAKIKVKFNHEEREMDEDEARPLVEKGMNYDKKVRELQDLQTRLEKAETLARRMGYQTPEEMLEAADKNLFESQVQELVDTGMHEVMARDYVQRKWNEQAAPHQQTVKDQDAQVKKEIDEFVRMYPGVTELPQEVLDAFQSGVSLPVAYERFRYAKAQEELKILKQNQSAAAKAPVAPTTKHGTAAPKAKDPFEAGFDSDDW